MSFKSTPVAFKKIYLSGKDQSGAQKNILIDGSASIHAKSQNSFSIEPSSSLDKPDILSNLMIDEVNGESRLYINDSDLPLQPTFFITKVKDFSHVSINGKAKVHISQLAGNSEVIARDNTSLQVTKLEKNTWIMANDNAKSDIKHCYGRYTGHDQSQNNIDTLYGGAIVSINPCGGGTNNIASSKIRVAAGNTENPFNITMDNHSIVKFIEKITGKFNINMSGNSILNALKGIDASSNKADTPSTITINDNSRVMGEDRIDGNIDITTSSKSPLPKERYYSNLWVGSGIGKDVKITQEGYSKTAIGDFEGNLTLLDNAYTIISNLTGNLNMGTMRKSENSLFKSNKSSADVKELSAGSRVTMSDHAILRYEEKNDNAEIIQKGILNRGSYHKVKSLND